MKSVCRFLILFLIVSNCYAGFGRSGRCGSFRSGGFSSRSYSAPRSYVSSYRPAPRVIYHSTTVHAPAAASGGGIHPLVAGIAGYMVGDALNRNHGQQQVAQAPPQVVYVNGQPQQAQSSVVQSQSQPEQQQMQAPVTQPAPAEEHGLFFWMFIVLFGLFGLTVVLNLVKKN